MRKNDLTKIDEGGLHSENILGGVPMNSNNTVEEGETVQNGFVYSNRIKLTPEIIKQYNLPKSLTNKTMADATKFIDNKFKDRNDKISLSTKDGMLSKIAEAQELMKPIEPGNTLGQNQMFLGGEMEMMSLPGVESGIDSITNLATGNNEQALNSGVKAGTTIAGTAIGGPIGGMIGGVVGDLAGGFISKLGNKSEEEAANRRKHIKESNQFSNDFAYGGKMYAKGGPLNPDADLLEIEKLKRLGIDNTIINDLAITEGINLESNGLIIPESYKLPKADLSKLGSTLGQAARYTPIAMNAYQLSELEKPSYSKLNRLDQRFNPEYVDERSLQNIISNETNNTINSLSGASNGSIGALRNNILGAGLNRTKALSEAYINAEAQNRATNVQGQQFNAGINATNLQQDNLELDINDRNEAAYNNERSKYLAEIGNGIGDIGKEEIYKKIASTTTGYNWLGEYQKMNPTATSEETEVAARKAGILIDSNSKALGGYLFKNKRK